MIVDQHGNPLTAETKPRTPAVVSPGRFGPRVNLRASFDAARTSSHNEKHWARADGLSAASANSYGVRKLLRERARYERDNNPYLRGMQRTLVKDLIGRRPRLQLQSGSAEWDRRAEAKIHRWLRSTKAAAKLRTARKSKGVDGESFFVRIHNPRLPGPVKTSFRVVEADVFEDPAGHDSENYVGGIEFDAASGDAISYSMLKQHPGDLFGAMMMQADRVDAADVVHWFESERPGQVRGVSEWQTGIGLFGQIRRYVLAVLTASETAADHAAVLETQATPFDDDGEPVVDDLEAFETVEVDRGMMVTLPRGWKMSQFRPEQPTATFESFRDALIDQGGRAQGMPSNKARGNSSQYNYASGRLDSNDWYEIVDVEREEMADDVLDRLVGWYVREARLVDPDFRDVDPDELPDHRWYFDAHPHADETKHARAVSMMVEAELMTKDDVLIAEGRDPENHWAAIRRQRERDAELAAIGPGPAAITNPNQPSHPIADEADDDEADDDDTDDDDTDGDETSDE